MKKLLLAPFLAALAAAPARAGSGVSGAELTPVRQADAFQDIVEVQTTRNPGAVIVRDALYGGLAGLLIGGGVALLNNGDNWGRDLAIGAGAGLLVGAIFGAVDAASADRYMAVVDSDARLRDRQAQRDHPTGLGYGLKF